MQGARHRVLSRERERPEQPRHLDDHSVEWAWYSRQFGEEWTRRIMARMVYSIMDYDEFGPAPDEEEEEEEHAV